MPGSQSPPPITQRKRPKEESPELAVPSSSSAKRPKNEPDVLDNLDTMIKKHERSQATLKKIKKAKSFPAAPPEARVKKPSPKKRSGREAAAHARRVSNLLETDNEETGSEEGEREELSIYLEIKLPPKLTRATKKGGAKPVDQGTKKAGPIAVPLDITFKVLLDEIATAVHAAFRDNYNGDVKLLAVQSFEYRPVTPANAKPLPLRNEAGLKAMLKELQKKIRPVLIFMDPPSPPPSSRVSCAFMQVYHTLTGCNSLGMQR
jgi:hypothetical protein